MYWIYVLLFSFSHYVLLFSYTIHHTFDLDLDGDILCIVMIFMVVIIVIHFKETYTFFSSIITNMY